MAACGNHSAHNWGVARFPVRFAYSSLETHTLELRQTFRSAFPVALSTVPEVPNLADADVMQP